MRVAVLFALASSLFAQATGVVEGRLASSTTHAGIAAVRLSLRAITEQRTYTATTDASGGFRFADLPPGEYLPDFRVTNYVDRAMNVFTVVPGRDPIRLDVELEPFGKLSGRVLDNARQPVENATVVLVQSGGERALSVPVKKDGSYSIPALIPGKWRMQAYPASEPKSWESDAEDVRIPPGQEITGYDIRTRPVPVLKVRGEVLNPSGRPVPGVTVEARGNRGVMLRVEATKLTDAEGAFEIPLPAGTWHLSVNTVAPLNWYGAVSVTLLRSNVENVRIRFVPRFSLPVMVEGAPPEGVNLFLLPAALPGYQVRALRSGRINEVAPGRYRMQIRSVPPGTYLESIFLGEQDVLGQEVDLYEGSPPLRLVYRPDPPAARGTVEKGQGAQVVFIPQDEMLRGEYSIGTAVCDASGRFGVTGLRPGSYYAFAFDRLRSMNLLNDPAFIRTLVPQAARVEMRKGESTSVDLKLIPWPE